MTQQTLPNLMMPHHTATCCDDEAKVSGDRVGKTGTMATGPFTMDKIRPALEQVQHTIDRHMHSSASNQDCMAQDANLPRCPPFIITMARSSADGFTPAQVVDKLQGEILQFVHTLYCGCPRKIDNLNNTITQQQQQQQDGSMEKCQFRFVLDYGIHEGSCFMDWPPPSKGPKKADV
eukprot:Sro168_g074780.1 Inherit from euNOG: chromosome 5 open reading frame 22 (177) ;mRNA; r:38011-38541